LENAMHIKKRGNRAMLYRSAWVKKGVEGNSHGFARQTYIGSLALDALALTPELIPLLTGVEISLVDKRILLPARLAAQAHQAQAERQKRDPLWRLEEAVKLVLEAAELSAVAIVPQGRIKALTDALALVKSIDGAASLKTEIARNDPLADALKAIRAAACAVRDGRYGYAPVGAARQSSTYATWMNISKEIEGTGGPECLLRALQGCGWVKARGAVAR
jgi:hypothetical protein